MTDSFSIMPMLRDMMLLQGLGAAALLVSLFATQAFIRFLRRREVLAHANERSMHTGAVPTGGGWIIVLLSLAALFALQPLPSLGQNATLIAATLGLTLVSWLDDAGGLAPLARILAHIGAVAAVLLALDDGRPLLWAALPHWLDLFIAGLGWVWFVNLFNFMDGIDGIAGGEIIAITIGVLVVATKVPMSLELLMVCVVIAAATLGFLWWNWRPAKVYLGDTGAIPLGFLAGWLLVHLAREGHLAAALLLPASFLADASLTLLRRLVRGEKVWQAHRSHLYQRAALALQDHAAVVWRFAVANLLLIGAALVSVAEPLAGIVLGVTVVAGLLLHLRRIAGKPSS